ncbi:MAG: SAM-dependent methyltransferase [Alistipes sp.]|nr:SAM-dependent methyltransferase [Alistipes sp.]MBQ2419561.1 SAM-dependent methyltransferase [Alistipes sp.]
MSATLYLIPCPISDDTAVADVTPAANQAIIDSLDYFIVENTRSARRFLSKSGYAKAIDEATFVELNEHTTSPTEIARMIEPLKAGRSAGVISEAGVPAVADPGQAVVELCHKHNIRVVPLVGPSSILMAVMASGLSGQSFAFNGYLPIKEPERSKTIKRLESRARTEHQSQLFIEAPYRNVKLLEQMLKSLNPDTRLCVACDITSKSEYIRTQTVAQWCKSTMPDIQKRPTIFIIG